MSGNGKSLAVYQLQRIVKELQEQNEALLAQVGQLRKYGNLCAVNLSYSTDAFASEYKALWKKAASATPSQCLAEIKAQADSEFMKALFYAPSSPVSAQKAWEIEDWYGKVKALRQQAKAGE